MLSTGSYSVMYNNGLAQIISRIVNNCISFIYESRSIGGTHSPLIEMKLIVHIVCS